MKENALPEELTELRQLQRKVAHYEAGADASERSEGEQLTPERLWHLLLEAPAGERLGRLDAQLAAIEAGHRVAQERDIAREKVEVTQGLLDRALREVANRDDQLRGLDLTIAHLQGQIAALERTFTMSQELIARAMLSPQVGYAEVQSFQLDGLDEELPARREEPAVLDVQRRVTDQLKSAGIDTSARCGYEWDGDGQTMCDQHACGIVNPLHLGDHECEQGCRATCSQQEAERIEEAKQSAT